MEELPSVEEVSLDTFSLQMSGGTRLVSLPAHTLTHDFLSSCLRSFSRRYLFYLLVFFTVVLVLLVTLKKDSPLTLLHVNRQPSMIVQPDFNSSYVVPSNVTLPLSPTLTIRPERFHTYINPNIYMSVLTVPKHHPTKFALQLLTWMQTFNPKQVNHVYSYSLIVGSASLHSWCLPIDGCVFRLW